MCTLLSDPPTASSPCSESSDIEEGSYWIGKEETLVPFSMTFIWKEMHKVMNVFSEYHNFSAWQQQ